MTTSVARVSFTRRHLLTCEELTAGEIGALLDLADKAAESNRQVIKKRDVLRGRTLINLFFEASTRTQSSFELAGKRLGRRTTVCTIYEGNLEAAWAPLARVALMVFNDVILRIAFERAIDVIDLRLVCTEAADYANPIEPSGSGGRKIAAAIVAAVGAGEGRAASRVFGQP